MQQSFLLKLSSTLLRSVGLCAIISTIWRDVLRMHRCQRREVHNLDEKCSQLNDYIRGIHRRRKQRHTGVTNNGTFTMTEGTISGNSARQNLPGRHVMILMGIRYQRCPQDWKLAKKMLKRACKYEKQVLLYFSRLERGKNEKEALKNKTKKLLTKALEFDILSELRLTRERGHREHW